MDAQSTDIWALAQNPFLWACALAVYLIITIQSVIYMRAAKTAGRDIGMDKKTLTTAFRSGAIASIGPSLAVLLVAVALLAVFATPAVLMRIGLVGSAATETTSATVAAETMDASLGGSAWTQEVFVVAFAAMCISGGMWMISTLIMTPILKRGGSKMERVNPEVMRLVPGAALLGVFAVLSIDQLPESSIHAITVLISGLSLAVMLYLSRFKGMSWLKEWALGLAIFLSLTVAYFLHHHSALA